MRKPSFVNSLKMALMVVPLLTGCGNSSNTSPPVVVVDPNGLLLPDCTEGQLVGINADQTLGCVTVSSMLNPPKCAAGTQALTSTKDSVTMKAVLSCVDKGAGATDVTTSTRISNASSSIMTLQTTIGTLTTGGGTRSKYIGSTTVTPNGNISTMLNGKTVGGARAASALCEAAFVAGAHMCTPMEIFESLAIGDKLNQNTVAITTGQMVYLQGWTRGAGSTEPNAGLNENCGGQTYDTADRGWHNTVFTFAPASATITTKVAKFDQASPVCQTKSQIACCK